MILRNITVLVSIFVFSLSSYAQSVNMDSVRELFTISTEYCQAKINSSDEKESRIFSFMLSQIMEKSALHLSIHFDTGKVWFTEPMTGIHQMTDPKVWMVEDKNLAEEIASVLYSLNRKLFATKSGSTALAADVLIDLASWKNPTAPRDQIFMAYEVRFVNKISGKDEIVSFTGNLSTTERRSEESPETKLNKLESELKSLYEQLTEVEKSDACSKEMAIRRLMREIEDVERQITELKKALSI